MRNIRRILNWHGTVTGRSRAGPWYPVARVGVPCEWSRCGLLVTWSRSGLPCQVSPCGPPRKGSSSGLPFKCLFRGFCREAIICVCARCFLYGYDSKQQSRLCDHRFRTGAPSEA